MSRPSRPAPSSLSGEAAAADVSGSGASTEPLAPMTFRLAVEALQSTSVRPEIRVEPIRAPQRLAPYSFALAADILPDADSGVAADGDAEASLDGATGRLVLLHDPDGAEAWDGDLRLVVYASAELAPDMAGDPLLSEVGWSWLIGALEERGAGFTAAGGTITQTTSTRFGDQHGPSTATALEMRASWTPTSSELSAHLLAFTDTLAIAAGLPPEGITVLGR